MAQKLLTSIVEIGKRYKEHFSDLLNRDSDVDEFVLISEDQSWDLRMIHPPWRHRSIYQQAQHGGRLPERTVYLLESAGMLMITWLI